ncbi:hypothetical protein [Victivallis sp. Marseille-Q1083]|uniref:hypothetical protein n=1 Tax=Victivallis sp. Marseille-Q1083 TaxID=2717288 RepID=UPI001C377E05|nr:hypothetical protein [Victivallis sp. Marseille-Q1083]
MISTGGIAAECTAGNRFFLPEPGGDPLYAESAGLAGSIAARDALSGIPKLAELIEPSRR